MSKHDTFLRQWAMLRLVPRDPRKIDTQTIQRKLADEGFRTTDRTIQRDLNSLSAIFPLQCDDREKPYRWFWTKGGRVLDIPGMGPVAALGFRLAETYLTPMLPKATLDYLTPHFQRAHEVLNQSTHSGYRWWASKVRTLPRGLDLMPAEISTAVQSVVYQALFEGRRFQAEYSPRGSDTSVEYEVNPLGLVFRQGVVYLVATLWNYDDIKQLALHRLRRATLVDKRAKTPPGFALDDYIKGGEFAYPLSSTPIKLRLLFDTNTAHHLLETPLAEAQVVLSHPGRGTEIRATVPDTSELRWWLLGFGDGVEVLAPKKLRAEFHSTSKKMYARYRD